MWEFVRPIRRRIGVVTLVLACVFMTGWVRSFFVADWIEGSKFKFISFDGGGCWEHTENFHEFLRKLSISTASAEYVQDEYRFSTRSARWKQQLFGFGLKTYGGEYRKFGGIVYNTAFTVYRIPYWAVVIPLTLLSAYLLLAKRRPAKKSNSPLLTYSGLCAATASTD